MTRHSNSSEGMKLSRAESSSYWIPQLAPLGVAPYSGKDYKFYRNVVDYGADNTGAKPADEAINAAVQDGDRCGEECGNTFVQGALIYFPFVGDAVNRPTLKGCSNFTGIAIIDVDPYIPNMAAPDGGGVNWYINQNQFFRQIRNLVFDMKDMPAATDEHGQQLVPTGIHWQVSQACSLQNLRFEMPQASSSSQNITHVGIFTENGSGGFVSDLEFEGGAIGWRVGSQQYTAIGLRFKNCITAVQMVWDWGFNWQRIHVDGGTIAFNISGQGGIGRQGIGSVSIIDSDINNVPIGILTNNHEDQAPNIVIDNTVFTNVGAIVQLDSGSRLLEGGSQTVQNWAHGRRYEGKSGERRTGHFKHPPRKSSKLLDGGKLFTRLRPQYEQLSASSFLIATEHGCKNDATGDNTAAINSFLQQAVRANKIAYFPAGIYNVQDTVDVPVGSRVQGTSWSQLQASGTKFQDMDNPRVVVRVGKQGDEGVLEIVDMLFTVKGNTAGAIMMEWNVHEPSQGSAAMWDSHIRVGGGIGTDLDAANCPKLAFNEACICASMLLHVTKTGSGYFENVWAWIADHDNDMSLYWEVDSLASQISLYGARGILVESQGPCWFYGSGSEHAVLYQYQLYKAKDIYLGHIQTESPYFQPVPGAPSPFNSSSMGLFAGDPKFEDCETESCKEAWGLRIIESEGISIHSAGLYSWFTNYGQQCLSTEDCQQRIMEVTASKDVAIYNIFVKGAQEIATTSGYSIDQSENQQGYTSEISIWLPYDDAPEVVYIGTEIYQKPTASCHKPCVMVLAPSPLPSTTTISIKPYTTSLQVGSTITTITVTPKPVTTDKMPFYNVNITAGATDGAIYRATKSLALEDVVVTLSHVAGTETATTTRRLQLPPWPQINNGPPENWNLTTRENKNQGGKTTRLVPSQGGRTTTHIPPPPPTTTVFHISPQCTSQNCPPMDDKRSNDEHKTVVWIRIKCDELWFFNFCIDVNGLRVRGWEFPLPKGIIGPGPPPFVPKIRGWHLVLPPILPPWPVIEVGGPGLHYGEKDPSCEDNKVSVPVQLYTRSYGLSISSGTTVTTATRTITETAYETGCPTPEWTSTAACDANVRRTASDLTLPRTQIPTATPIIGTDVARSIRSRNEDEWAHDFDCQGGESDVIIYLKDESSETDDEQVKKRLKYDFVHFEMESKAFQHESLYILFFYAWNMPKSLRDKFAIMPMVENIRTVESFLNDDPKSSTSPSVDALKGKPMPGGISPRSSPEIRSCPPILEDEQTSQSTPRKHRDIWWLSQISSYPGEEWEYEGTDGGDLESPLFYEYYHDKSLGEGQVVYLLEEGLDTKDEEFSEASILLFSRFDNIGFPASDVTHGTAVSKLMVGKTFGVASKATLVAFDRVGFFVEESPIELLLIALLRIIEHIEANMKDNVDNLGDIRGRCVINKSFRYSIQDSPEFQPFSRGLERLSRYLQDDLNCLMVASAGNNANTGEHTDEGIFGYLKYAGGLPNLLVAGACGKAGYKARMSEVWSSGDDQDMIYAAGLRLQIPGQEGTIDISRGTGTSLAAPLISGLAAYLRALDSKWKVELRDPRNLLKLIRYLSRKLHVTREEDEYGGHGSPPGNDDNREDEAIQPHIIWNGQVKNENCLVGYVSEDSKAVCDMYVKEIPGSLESWNPPEVPDPCDLSTGSKRDLIGRASCEVNGARANKDARGFQWKQGNPSPTCTSSCGTLCTGYYCSPHPTGQPPDYYDHSTTIKGDGGLTGLPPLTHIPTPVTNCAGQIKPTTICNGSGGRMACVTSSYCSSDSPPTPTATDMLCQINRGCRDYPCPEGEYGLVRGATVRRA
ncbi:exo-beta-1,3-glucanase [Cordyceps militaris CM01]|uniref:Exo-beta-1,3-glucanase n=1 Tax=Cordyceps militaris (strain CM01) TaxID=983644 RepID=G3JBA2_CORMM|nr:exo-beta-1,3-glucanase [Cordyceps militaris CM01]EGX95260.1 exo-beta-1,3-glucanase [Cordyceps militaris CM01]